MTILRLFWLDVQKMFCIRLMGFFILLPALLAFNGWFVSIAYLVYLYLVPYGLFSYDDNAVADNLYGALPVRREQVAAARYLFALFCMALMMALMLLVNTVFAMMLQQPLLAEDFITSLILGFVVGLLFIGVSFPLALSQGLRKATNNVLMIFVLAFIIMSFYGDNLRGLSELPQVNARSVAVFCLVALLISFTVTLRLYIKREFFDYIPLGAVHRAKKR